jgi:cytochrome P450
MIDLILEANQTETEDGYCMPDDVMRDNMINLMAAGTETTATAMTWTLYFLHKYPEVKDSIHSGGCLCGVCVVCLYVSLLCQ